MTGRDRALGRLRHAALPALLVAAGCWSTAVDVLQRADAADGEDDGGPPLECRLGAGDCPGGTACDVRGCEPGATGACAALPAPCPVEWNPVCGCDDRTYWNDCERLRAGAARSRSGACDRECGLWSGGGCDGDDLCAVDGCLPATGRCVARPSTCGAADDPACGCDGATYAGRCEMFEAGVALSHAGECSAAPCAPVCETVGAGTAWVDPCTRETICAADCAGCSANCEFSGLPLLEGWYAWCPPPDIRDGGCGEVLWLIAQGGCG